MSKHTPVTWFVDIEGNRILANDDRATIICHMSATVKNPDVMAAANKISAAPELLEALGSLLAAYSEPDQRICCSGFGCGCMGATTYQQAEHYARAAIAKAKGESA